MSAMAKALFGGASGSASSQTYVDDVFSTYLYTGNGSTQTITNGIDLAGKGGLVWIKSRSDAQSNILVDTLRGPTNSIFSNLTNNQTSSSPNGLNSFSSVGFSVADNASGASYVNGNGSYRTELCN